MRTLRHPWRYTVEAAERRILDERPDLILRTLTDEARTAQVHGGTAVAGVACPPRKAWLLALLVAAIVAGADAHRAAHTVAAVMRRYPRAGDERGPGA